MFKVARNFTNLGVRNNLGINFGVISNGLTQDVAATPPSNKSEEVAPPAEHPELDDLYKKVLVQVKGHDLTVLESYTKFVKLTCKELEIEHKVLPAPHRFIERWTLLKSRFSNRKHMRQYEMRTHFREYEFKRLTGSTCDTLLEFIQRNLPEGVAMHVHKTQLTQLPTHFHEKSDVVSN